MIPRLLEAAEDERLRPMFWRMALFVVGWDLAGVALAVLLAVFVSGYLLIPAMLLAFGASGLIVFVAPGLRPTRTEIGWLGEYGFPVGRFAPRKDDQ